MDRNKLPYNIIQRTCKIESISLFQFSISKEKGMHLK